MDLQAYERQLRHNLWLQLTLKVIVSNGLLKVLREAKQTRRSRRYGKHPDSRGAVRHSRSQRPRSFWPAPRIATSGILREGNLVPGVWSRGAKTLGTRLLGGSNFLSKRRVIVSYCRPQRPRSFWSAPKIEKELGLWGQEWFSANPISFPEPTCLLVSTKTRSSGIINFQRPRF